MRVWFECFQESSLQKGSGDTMAWLGGLRTRARSLPTLLTPSTSSVFYRGEGQKGKVRVVYTHVGVYIKLTASVGDVFKMDRTSFLLYLFGFLGNLEGEESPGERSMVPAVG